MIYVIYTQNASSWIEAGRHMDIDAAAQAVSALRLRGITARVFNVDLRM